MTRYVVELAPRSVKDLDAASPEIARRISKTLRQLEERPVPRGDTVKRLEGFQSPTYRLRIGDDRAIYRIHESVVVVLRIIHRSELHRALRDLA